MKKRKLHILAALLCGEAIAAASFGITQSLLTARSPTYVNNINIITNDSVTANLLEPEWDGVKDYELTENGAVPIFEYRMNSSGQNQPVYGYENGDYSLPVFDKNSEYSGVRPKSDAEGNTLTYGIDKARNMIPGSVVTKDPYIYNTSDGVTERVAAKITFVYAGADGQNAQKKGMPLNAADMLNVYDIIEIDYSCDKEGSKWKRIDEDPYDDEDVLPSDTSQVFYYDSILLANQATEKLFTTVRVKEDASSDDIAFLKSIGGFAIHIEGFVVQARQTPTKYEEFEAWGINGGIVFNHTPTYSDPINFDDDTGIVY